MPRYATGGTHVIGGEYDREAVWLSNGAQGMNAVATESRFGGDRRSRAADGSINFYRPVMLQAESDIAYMVWRSQAISGQRR